MDEERERRIQALHALTKRQHADSPEQSTEIIPSRTRARRIGMRWSLAIAIVLVGVAAGGIILHSQQFYGRSAESLGPLNEAHGAGLACSSAAAWAPNGRYFAVLGSIGLCGKRQSSDSDPSQAQQVLVIVDANSGKLVREIRLAKYLHSTPYGNCYNAEVSVCYNGLLWSPDSGSIALTATLPSSDPIRHRYQLLLVQADGSGAVTIPGTMEPQPESNRPTMTLWDLQARSVRYMPIPLQFATAHTLIWQPNGTLGDSPTSPGSVPAPVGISSGGSELSPWQPGDLNGGGSSYDFTSHYWAWSPDARHIMVGLVTNVVLPPPGGTSMPPAAAPYVSSMPRDAALVAVEHEISTHPSEGSDTPLAWDSSGRYLAALRCSAPDTARLSIYATSTGSLVTSSSVQIPIGGPRDCRSLAAAMSLSWSPSSRTVLMVDSDAGGMALWKPSLH